MKKLKVKTATGYRFINLADIVYLEVVKNIVTIYLKGKEKERFVAVKSLKYFEGKLKTHGFGRMNQQQVVNHAFITAQDNMKIPNLTLEGYEVKIPLSPAYKQRHGAFYL